MVEDVEAVRIALHLGKITLLGHSYGGALAQAYALKYQKNLTHLILASTWSNTKELNQVFVRMKQKMPPELRDRINRMEAEGLFGHGLDYQKNRYSNDYFVAAWGEGIFLISIRTGLTRTTILSRRKYQLGPLPRMWGPHGEYVVDGNLKSVEYTDRLASIHSADAHFGGRS